MKKLIIALLIILIVSCFNCYAETKNVLCLSTVNNISQQIFTVHIFHFKLEAENFARQNDGIVLKEHGQDIYQVFFKKDLLYCPGNNFIYIE